MALEWIDQNYAGASNVADRKRVRSQAMKNYRSRQRAERQAAVTLALDKAARRSMNARSKPAEPPASQSTRKRKAPAEEAKPGPHVPARPGQSSTALVPSSLLRSPALWDCDAFLSPAQVDQIIGFCASYLHQVRPVITHSRAANVISNAWHASPCPMLLAACSLAAAGDIEDARQPEGIYKAQVLHELRERMKFPETTRSDETVSALMFLTAYDLSRANVEARTHLHALNAILERRDGSQLAQSRSMMLEILDLTQAVMFNSVPLTTVSKTSRPTNAWEMTEILQSLLTAEHQAFNERSQPSETIKLRGLNKLLASAFASLQAIVIYAPMGGIVFDNFYDCLEEFRQTNCRDVDRSTSGVQHIARVCYHQHAILYNLIANGKPYRHPSNATHVSGLCIAIKADVREPWQKMPFLRMVVLLTGLASSRQSGHKAFFKTRLIQSMYELGIRKWPEMRDFILMFLTGRDYLQKNVAPSQYSKVIPTADTVSMDSSADTILPEDDHIPSEQDDVRRRRVQELLSIDHGFHEVIRQGNCWLTEHA